MKRTATLFLLFITTLFLVAQNPIAVNDTTMAKLGEFVTIKVIDNDYSPEGLSFKVLQAPAAHSFTDSTITYFLNYDKFYNFNHTYWGSPYVIIDENGQSGSQSEAMVYIAIINNVYYDTLDINNIRTTINAYNNQFWDGDGLPFFEYPKGSGKHTVFNQTIWIGGIDENDQLKLAAERYQQIGLDFWPGPISFDGNNLGVDTSTAIEWHRVWKLNAEEVIYHKLHYNNPGYEPIENIETWPAHGDPELNQSNFLAPFIDINGDSIYDPYSGDYPLIRGDQCIFFICNDYREHTESEGKKLGVEIHGMAYEFDRTQTDPMSNTVFLSYKVFNRSPQSLKNTFIGLFCDFDIGYPYDDFVGCDISRGAYFGYNGNDIDGNNQPEAYGINPPAQGIVVLGGPYVDPNGIDDNDGECDESITGVGFGDGVVDNERYGMTKFVYFNNNAGIQGDPESAEEYYNYMKAIWKDGTAMEYGGNAHISSGAYGPACNFMFPGLSDPCFWGTNREEPYGPVDWTEEFAGNKPFDRRGLSVMGPFTFKPHAMQKVDLAFVTARGENGPQSSVDLLKEYIDEVKQEYFKDTDYFGYQWLGKEEKKLEKQALKVYPNPAKDEIQLQYHTEVKTIYFMLNDAFGRIVKEGEMPATGSLKISIGELENGVYILSIIDQKKAYSTKILKN